MFDLDARIVGAGRAGGALALALADAGWRVAVSGREPVPVDAPLLILAVPDRCVAEVAAGLTPSTDRVVVHLAGSLTLDVLGSHLRTASVHPLVALPDAATGARRLRGAWFAHAGDPAASAIVEALAGRVVTVDEARRTEYHAAACIASNHLVALLGQAERVAAVAGVPLAAYLDLVRATVDNVAELGAAAALTGPVARGDWDTVARHLAAIDPAERPAYEALADRARVLVAS